MSDNGFVPLLALIALAVVVLQSVAEVLPDDPLFWVVTPIRVVIVLGLLALVPTVRRIDRASLAWRWPLDLCALVLLAAAALPAHRFDAWSDWRGLLTCVAVASLAAGVVRNSIESWRAITLIGFGAVATAAFTGIRQTVQGIPTGFCRGALDGSADSCGHAGVLYRAIGTFGNPNLLSAFLVLMIPLAVAYAAGHTQRQSRTIAYLVAAAGVVGVLVTGSRGALVALAAMGVAFVVLRRPTGRNLIIGGAGVVVALAAGAVAVAAGQHVGVRADVWTAAATLIRQYPLGVGLGRTGPLLADAVPGSEQFRHAHNLWLDTLLATGPLGLLAMIGLTAFAAYCVIRAARQGSAAGIALGCSLAGFAALCLVDDPINAIRNAYAAWLVLGLAVGACHPARRPSHGLDGAEDAPVLPRGEAGAPGAHRTGRADRARLRSSGHRRLIDR